MRIPFFLLVLFILTACGEQSTLGTDAELTRPDFINWDYADRLTDDRDPTNGRKVTLRQANVSVHSLTEEIVVLAETEAGENFSFVLQQEENSSFSMIELDRAYFLYLQDHLLLVSSDGTRRIRLSLTDKALESSLIAESATFTESYFGFGLAKYHGIQPVRASDLEEVNSYQEARARYAD